MINVNLKDKQILFIFNKLNNNYLLKVKSLILNYFNIKFENYFKLWILYQIREKILRNINNNI